MDLKPSDLKVASSPEEAAWHRVCTSLKERLINSAVEKELDEAALKVAEAKLKSFKTVTGN